MKGSPELKRDDCSSGKRISWSKFPMLNAVCFVFLLLAAYAYSSVKKAFRFIVELPGRKHAGLEVPDDREATEKSQENVFGETGIRNQSARAADKQKERDHS